MSNTDPLTGRRLGDYLIEGLLGTGGMARVYRGYDEQLDRYAAVKVIEASLVASADEEEYRERFLREARAIARLNHPRIVKVYQFGQVDELYYIAIELIDGQNLRDILREQIKQDTFMPVHKMLRILRDIADALDYAHQNGIIHRDVKPSNIIVTPEGQGVLTDFGLALNAIEGTIGNTFGSVHYIAPEQAISSSQSVPQSDQYALGIIAYEMLTGRVPFDEGSAMSVAMRHISESPVAIREINPAVPQPVERVVMRALSKDYRSRYPDSTAFIDALSNAFDDEGDDFSENRPAPSALSKRFPLPARAVGDGMLRTGPDATRVLDSAPVETVMLKKGETPGPLPQSRGMQIGIVAGTFLLILLILGSLFILPGLFREDEVSITRTAEAVVAQAIANTATAESIAIMTIDAAIRATYSAATQTADAFGTATVDAEMSATADSYLTATESLNLTATFFADVTNVALIAITQTAEMQLDMTATAQTDATATAQAEIDVTGTAVAEVIQTATEIAAIRAESAANATLTAQVPLAETATAVSEIIATATSAAQEDMTLTAIYDATRVENIALTRTQRAEIIRATQRFQAAAAAVATQTPSSTPRPSDTPTVTVTPSPMPTRLQLRRLSGDLRLLYDGETLVAYNADNRYPANINDVIFVRVEPNGLETRFEAAEWGDLSDGLEPNQCLQVWTIETRLRPLSAPYSELCAYRQYYRSTTRPFWLSEHEEAFFEIRLHGDVLATCPTAPRGSSDQLRCDIELTRLKD